MDQPKVHHSNGSGIIYIYIQGKVIIYDKKKDNLQFFSNQFILLGG